MRTVRLLVFAIALLSISHVCEAGSFTIQGQEVPLIEGAVAVRQESRKSNAMNVAAYRVDKPVKAVAAFYQDFFSANGFEVIGGANSGEYNVSVKKDATLFTVRIYTEDGHTAIQFIW